MTSTIDQSISCLVIASGNDGKVKEFQELLSELPINVEAQPEGIKVEENGTSFVENARIKALAVSEITGKCALADDSGLSVNALDGAPGIHSARYASCDSERINKLLKNLEPFENREANFTAALCIASKKKVIIEVEAKCYGAITYYPRGKKGFGYDPIFEVIELGMTFAEMGPEKKRLYGHRGLAFKLLMPKLKNILDLTSDKQNSILST